ncbi:baculoviral IAP repeat-containing protein 7 [Galleria mellonella]|uniref:Baculoviral IAP repeat-containing protein 7 n=1 Tax=Galleria mellonella TaxID=7137 RepID=A0A6J1W905_GALME|nr:baculoviral IAP repeat-containing protein 7 [Galleria mellonella]
MNYETNRLNTFTNWPTSAPVDPIRIAKAGFYYTGVGTEVQCFNCSGKISEWNYGDQVMWRHRQLDPNCEFVVNPQQSGNVPLVLGSECPSNIDPTASWSASNDQQHDPIESSQDYGLTEEDEVYKSDALRLLSFVNWNDTSVSREALASAGFYHVGEGRLRCAWCGGELAPFRQFGTLGPPLEVHRMYFPRCEHAASLEASRQVNHFSPPASPQPQTPPAQSPPETEENHSQSTGAEHNARLLEAGGTWRSLGVVGGGARHPTRASLAARLATFERWPADRTQVPMALAEAGFFYTGTDDQVRCFYCDGGLGKWEAGDAPWSEHAHWFPHCGYVLLLKGQDFVDSCRNRTSVQRTFSADSGLSARRRNPGVNFSITESQVEECMESSAALAALNAGLDAARVRRALARRLRATGLPFNSSEALIDAVLDEQLNEEAWSVSPQSHRFARDILAETLREFAPMSGIIPTQWDGRPESRESSASPTRSASPVDNRPTTTHQEEPDSSDNLFTNAVVTENKNNVEIDSTTTPVQETPVPENKTISLEEENRQLKEARLCKVCMDNEVSVVFLPCGHLVSCARCGAALSACPLCRASVRALVRAYLA